MRHCEPITAWIAVLAACAGVSAAAAWAEPSLALAHSSTLTPDHIRADGVATALAKNAGTPAALHAVGGPPAALVAEAIEAHASALAVARRDGARICAALKNAGLPCRGMHGSNRAALVDTGGAISDATAIYERPELLNQAAIVWPPTSLLAGFLAWAGAPESQVVDILSTRRGFDYAFTRLFARIDAPIWCNDTKAAIETFAAGRSRSVLIREADVHVAIRAARAAGAQPDLAGPDIIWFDLSGPSAGILTAVHQITERIPGYERFDTLLAPRADAIWHAAVRRAHARAPLSSAPASADCSNPE